MFHKKMLVCASLSGAVCVALGALGAHGFRDILEQTLPVYEKAVFYQAVHTLALLALASLYQHFPDRRFASAGWLWLAGIVLFSGSLYTYALMKGMHNESFNWLVHVTPFGGLCFILGWLMIFYGTLKMKSS